MKALLYFIIFSVFLIQLYGLSPQTPLQQSMHSTWTARDGLPSDTINDIIQDCSGYIWIGTFNGLVRFDGINFVTFSKHKESGFESNSVTSLLEGVDGTLWIGTNGEGLARYAENEFKMFNEGELENTVIKSLVMDESGLLWIGTGNGLVTLDRTDTVSTPLNGTYDNKGIEMIYLDNKGQLWISTTDGGISVYSKGIKINIAGLDHFSDKVVTSVITDKNRVIWIGTKSNGLFAVDNGSLIDFSREKQISAKTITSILQGLNGCVWITTDSGLFRFSKNQFHQYSERDGLSDNQVSKVMEDKEGSIWIATTRGGLNKLSDGKFVMLTTMQGLIHDKVNAVFQEENNTLWIGTDGGLSVLKNNMFLSLNIIDYLKGTRIRHINKDSRNRIWICTYSDLGIVSFDKGKIQNITVSEGLTGNRCRVSLEDHHGNIWIGTSNGLNLLDKRSAITSFTKTDGLADNYVLSLFEDSEKKLWITTNGGGISILENGKFRTIKAADGLLSNIVFRIYEDSEHVKWISTSRGISRYDGKHFFNFTGKNGLPENAVFQILEDRKGRFWLIAEPGIYIVGKNTLNQIASGKSQHTKVTLYNNLDGLLDSPTPVSWAAESKEGIIIFPTLMGVASIDTLNIPINEKPPPLLIEMVKVDNRNFSPLQLKILSPNYKRLTFGYTALSYVIPHKVQYKYILEGFDEDWSPLTTRREVSYTTLPPGDYTFRVKAVNNDGVWNTGDVFLSFSQKPFFYQTLWFFIVTFLLVIGVIALLFGMRIRTLRKRGIELEKQVAERTAELRTTDRIVANINKEIHIDKLLRVLLQQTMILFPQADKGVILTYDHSKNKFVHQVSRGYEDITTSGVKLSLNEAFNRFVKSGTEFEEGIYVHREFSSKAGQGVIPKIDIPESMIAMTITFGETVDGFFILENMNDSEAFTKSDAIKLMRVREHAISAVFKARTHQKLEDAAINDPLTGLHNRRKLKEILENERVRSERTDQPFCIVMCDIDHFKKFNDTYGHDCGDYVLVKLSQILRSAIRKQDFVGRWGGEEFLFVYPETMITGGKTVTEKVRSVIEETAFEFNEIKLNITMTFGISMHTKGKTIDAVIKEADDALYSGKQQGRNCVIVSE